MGKKSSYSQVLEKEMVRKMLLTVVNNVGVTNNSCCISIVVVFQYCKFNSYNEIHPQPLLKSGEDPGF